MNINQMNFFVLSNFVLQITLLLSISAFFFLFPFQAKNALFIPSITYSYIAANKMHISTKYTMKS